MNGMKLIFNIRPDLIADGWIKSLLLSLLLVCSFSVNAQDPDESRYLMVMEEGIKLMENGEYQEADLKFKMVLRNMEVLPSDISFHFGKNSYYLNQYKQSINWLNKYIELKGTRGLFFDEAVEYLKRAELAYQLDSEKNAEMVREELSRTNEFDCQGKTHFQCPLCQGEGVLIKPGKMDNTLYQTCPFCTGNGFLTCEEYKKYLKGELKSE